MDEKRTRGKSKSAKTPKEQPKKAPKTPKIPQGDLIFALDIGTRSVVGVLAKKTPEGCRILDMETVLHKTRSMSDGQIEDIGAVTEDVKHVRRELERRRNITLSKACVAAAGRTLKTLRASWEHKLPLNKQITEEALRATELDAVRRTCEAFTKDNANTFYCVGHSVIERRLDGFRTAVPVGHRGESLVTEIIAAFLPVNVVESLCEVVEGAGMEVSGLTLEPIAAMNAVVSPELRVINLALCDIGAGTSDVAVSRDGSVVAYGMATVAGDEITEALMKGLLVDFTTAERIKTSSEKEIEFKNILNIPSKVTRERVDEIIAPAVRSLAKTIAEEIIAANGEVPQAVFLVGGSSKLRALPQFLSEELGLDVTRIIAGSRDTLRGIIAPDDMELGGEHSTPVGIAVSAGEGVQYDFTTITINGKKYRAPDTNRLTVFELLPFAKIKPENLIAGSGKSLSFTVSGEKKTLRGEPAKPSEITVNGEPASLNTLVKKGDEITVEIAKKGADASAKLSDYFDMSLIKSVTVTLIGEKLRAGHFLLVNGREITADRRIHDGDDISEVNIRTLSELLKAKSLSGEFLVNDEPKSGEYVLQSGDIISRNEPVLQTVPPAPEPKAAEAPVSAPTEPVREEAAVPEDIAITINGIEARFPLKNGKLPIFLDVAAQFAENPTELFKSANVITLNGKMARLDEIVHSGDTIVIE
ncbi:MAG: cell division protein FtsA [Oscillospiraceae bacterium]